jgi:hypothetical protein
MPRLQIDGVDIAELDFETAEELKKLAAVHGLGRRKKTAQFQTSVSIAMSRPRPEMVNERIDLEFEGVWK